VQAGDEDALIFEVKIAALAKRLVVLGNLVTFGQVGIEIVLAVEFRRAAYFAMQGKASLDSPIDRFAVRHRQGAGVAKADRADLGIGFAHLCLVVAGAEHFALGL